MWFSGLTWTCILIFALVFRYTRTIVNTISHWTYRPIPIPENPTYGPQDVTIILPTIAQGGDELEGTLRTCLRTEPYELILVTIDANVKNLTLMAKKINSKKIRVLSVREANKRRQMCRAIPEVSTRITIFADDDVIWPVKLLPWILAPFENPQMGGVCTSQRRVRPEKMDGWVFLNMAYLERRNWDCSACLHIDGGLPCLSGRTAAYRSSILQDEAFTHGFTNEEWQTMQLNADDDNFITRWLYSHNWKIGMQYHKEAEVLTTLEPGPKYLSQCLRWVRSNWRSNLTSMFIERHYWYTQPWSTYSVLLTTITSWSLINDPLMFFFARQASKSWSHDQRVYLFTSLALFIYGYTKNVKLLGHYGRYPVDVFYIPLYIAFGYFHSFIKLWGLVSLNETTWGSRDGADSSELNRIRMMPLPPYGSTTPDGRKSETFEFMQEMPLIDQLPAYDTHDRHRSLPDMTSTITTTAPSHD